MVDPAVKLLAFWLGLFFTAVHPAGWRYQVEERDPLGVSVFKHVYRYPNAPADSGTVSQGPGAPETLYVFTSQDGVVRLHEVRAVNPGDGSISPRSNFVVSAAVRDTLIGYNGTRTATQWVWPGKIGGIPVASFSETYEDSSFDMRPYELFAAPDSSRIKSFFGYWCLRGVRIP